MRACILIIGGLEGHDRAGMRPWQLQLRPVGVPVQPRGQRHRAVRAKRLETLIRTEGGRREEEGKRESEGARGGMREIRFCKEMKTCKSDSSVVRFVHAIVQEGSSPSGRAARIGR